MSHKLASPLLHMGIATIEPPPPPSAVHVFLPHNLVKCSICFAKVCPSVYWTVTLVSHASTVQDIEICFTPHDRGTFLVSEDQICNTEFRTCGRNNCVTQRHPLATDWTNNPSYLRTVQDKDANCYYSQIRSRIYVLSIGTKIGDLE